MNLLWQQIGLLVGLSGFLLWNHRLRVQAQRRADTVRPTGHGFRATELKARLESRREGYFEISDQRRHQTNSHDEFVSALRKSLLQLSFFRASNEPESPPSGHHHDPRGRAT